MKISDILADTADLMAAAIGPVIRGLANESRAVPGPAGRTVSAPVTSRNRFRIPSRPGRPWWETRAVEITAIPHAPLD
jgi:hypothetical protein